MAAPPDLLLVLDFEATCDNVVQLPLQEIIEFPVLAVESRSLKVVSEYHTYVTPEINPRLTPFCTELTGITQPMVDAGVSLKAALAGCHSWMASLGIDTSKPFPILSAQGVQGPLLSGLLQASSFAVLAGLHTEYDPAATSRTALFVTCGDWDMKHLQTESAVKGLHPAPVFSSWINAKVLYCEVQQMKQGRAPDMMGMLQGLDIQHEGRHHSGIDDCRNIARLTCELIRRNGSPYATSYLDASGKFKRAPGRSLPRSGGDGKLRGASVVASGRR